MRVIQDSDDELEDDLEASVLGPTACNASAQQGASTNNNASSGAGTGSTESLKRAFAEAHRNHLQPQGVATAGSVQHEPQSSVSLPDQRIKTCDIPSRSSTSGTPSGVPPEKQPVTYGKKSKSSSASAYIDLTDDQPKMVTVQVPLEPFVLQDENQSEAVPNGFLECDPRALFPEPSSTIPNATMTQQRILEGVTAPILLGLESDGDGPRCLPPVNDPVPWSQLMKFTQLTNTAEIPASSERQSHSGAHEEMLDSTQKFRRGHVGSPPKAKEPPLSNVTHSNEIESLDLLRPAVKPLSSQDLGISAMSHRMQAKPRETKDQDPMPQAVKHDLAAIGLPEEQYKPRPSRSRSLKIDSQASIDYSVRPEKAARISKRRQTTEPSASYRSAETDPSAITPSKVQQICDMGFTPSTTTRVLKRHQGDVSQSVEWLLNNNLSEDELAMAVVSKRKSKARAVRADKPLISTTHCVQSQDDRETIHVEVQVQDHEQQLSESTEDPDTAIAALAAKLTSPRVEVVIPMKSPNIQTSKRSDPPAGSQKKVKRRKTTSDVPESPLQLRQGLEFAAIVCESTKPKKRGRGRPKKSDAIATTDAAASVVQEAYHEGEVLHAIGPNMKMKTLLTECNDPVKVAHSPKGELNNVSSENRDQPSVTVQTSGDQSARSRSPEKSISTSKESPVTKGKVSYRVGLSKRARIAPLLRTLTSKK